ncbi:MAG: alkanesulfonate monooxygenase [Chloroflexi bacterium]|nr:alkanesulfonate monooxygenase [Chloroflexota bacterium]|tara:strand:- start:97688 stop:98806 length:1119 start_codon:yes stop_codon:yes gene_type:complete
MLKKGCVRPKTKFDWFIPIDGDGEHIGTIKPERPPTFGYLSEIVRMAEQSEFYSMLIPTRFSNGMFEENSPLAETWTTATALMAITQKIRFLIAVRPGYISTGLFAQMAAAFDNISDSRLDINLVPGGIQGDVDRFGESLDHSGRYDRAEEFLMACRKMWTSSGPVNFRGEYVNLYNAICSPRPKGDGPNIYLGGASPNAINLAGAHADVLLMWIQPVEKIRELITRANESANSSGRLLRFGLRTHIIARETEEQAWEASKDLLSEATDIVKSQRKESVQGSPMVGHKAQVKFADNHKLSARLWNGISEVRVNCGTAIVGSYQQVAEEIFQYWKLGIDEFILSGFPHLEECERVSEKVLPVINSLIDFEREV